MRSMMNRDSFRELEDMSDRLNRLLGGRSAPAGGRDESMALADWIPVVARVVADPASGLI